MVEILVHSAFGKAVEGGGTWEAREMLHLLFLVARTSLAWYVHHFDFRWTRLGIDGLPARLTRF